MYVGAFVQPASSESVYKALLGPNVGLASGLLLTSLRRALSKNLTVRFLLVVLGKAAVGRPTGVKHRCAQQLPSRIRMLRTWRIFVNLWKRSAVGTVSEWNTFAWSGVRFESNWTCSEVRDCERFSHKSACRSFSAGLLDSGPAVLSTCAVVLGCMGVNTAAVCVFRRGAYSALMCVSCAGPPERQYRGLGNIDLSTGEESWHRTVRFNGWLAGPSSLG